MLNARLAIAILAGNPSVGLTSANRDDAIQELAAAVEAESQYGDPDGSLTDWIAAGEYTGNETVESISAEWDERN